MNLFQQEIALQIRELTAKLSTGGWNGVHGRGLLDALAQVSADRPGTARWSDAVERASVLARLIGEFDNAAPQPAELAVALGTANQLADLLLQSSLSAPIDLNLLPLDPAEWTIVALGNAFRSATGALNVFRRLGFFLGQADSVEDIRRHSQNRRSVFVAEAAWLGDNPAAAAECRSGPAEAVRVVVAVMGPGDAAIRLQLRQSGADLLLDAPLDAASLLVELAGRAWMPGKPYRVMVVDGDPAMLEQHSATLRAAGFELLAVEDAGAIEDALESFSPEVCLLELETVTCRGNYRASVLRRDSRYVRLPMVYLAATAETDLPFDVLDTGDASYLLKPVDARRLTATVMNRARQFRLVSTTNFQSRLALKQLDSLTNALDVHAIVSLASTDGGIIDINQKFCEISGYHRYELIGHNHRIIKSGHHTPAFFEDMWQTIAAGRIWQGEIQNRRKDGSPYWVKSTIVPILDDNDLPRQYLSIRTDVTEQRRLLEERERQNRLLDLMRHALQNFIAGHDVAATSEMLLDGLLLLTNSAYGFIGEVQDAADGLPFLKVHAMSASARDWSVESRRLYEEQPATGMELHNLDNLIGAVLRKGETVIANAPAADARRGGQPAGHPPLDAFLGVPIRCGNLLLGMVGLANRPGGYDQSQADFLAPVTATYAPILEAGRLRSFQQHVIDDLLRANDAAEQAIRAKAEFLAGWGHELRTPLNAILGHAQLLLLSDVLDAAAQRQAEQIVEGAQRFSRLIGDLIARLDTDMQTDAAPLPAIQVVADPARKAPRRRILVAEDNPANQGVLRMQLGVLGFDADMAGDGMAALAKWRAGGYDLILADSNMPVMDGLALVRAIRAAERDGGGHIPIVAITAVDYPEELAACKEAGMDDALPKPIDLEQLRRLLGRWLPQTSLVAAGSDAPASAAVPALALDTDYLRRIVGDASWRDVLELIDLFTSTARADLALCHRLLAQGDGRGLAQAMHKLKSSARMVGALRFAVQAESLEAIAREGRLENAADLISELECAVTDVEVSVRKSGVAPAPTFAGNAPPDVALPRNVLLVDDDPVARRQFHVMMSSLGVARVMTAESGQAALEEIARADGAVDLLISDLNMPGMDGIEFLRRLAEAGFKGGLIIVSGVEERLLQSAVELIRERGFCLRGALRKPMTREAFLGVLSAPCVAPAAVVAAPARMVVSPKDIVDAIRRDEFEVHFQPKVDASTLCVVGVEALARWRFNGAAVPSEIFIEAAERHGLIGMLSEVLITKILIGGARLIDEGYALSIAANLSAAWLADIRLPEFIMASVHMTGFKAENLILEITETGVMADVATSMDVLTRLRLNGFKLSIDDFGTGYSSLEQLRRIPFNELKLDGGFVKGAAEKLASRTILAASIDMAHKLNLVTVAEGVETQADLDLVRGLGCDLIQGWFIAKAMPLDELLVWLHARLPAGATPA